MRVLVLALLFFACLSRGQPQGPCKCVSVLPVTNILTSGYYVWAVNNCDVPVSAQVWLGASDSSSPFRWVTVGPNHGKGSNNTLQLGSSTGAYVDHTVGCAAEILEKN